MNKTAPLPFQGQKRRFIGAYSLALKELKLKKEVSVIVDLFGGSGLLSHTAKRIFPECKVVYNDYDNFMLKIYNGSNDDLPTYLVYAEADANDPLNFKAYYRPLLELTNYKHVWKNIDRLADIEIAVIDAQTYMFASLNDNSGFYGGTATTVYMGVY